eukprot:3563394-Pyramimonas_sp.AAC.1
MACRNLSLQQDRATVDNMANVEHRFSKRGWLTFVDQKDPPSLESSCTQDMTTVVEIDRELGNELNG